MAESMVQRVADALQREWSQIRDPYEDEEGLRFSDMLARAAITAMREPTEDMLLAGSSASAPDRINEWGDFDAGWAAAITKALEA